MFVANMCQLCSHILSPISCMSSFSCPSVYCVPVLGSASAYVSFLVPVSVSVSAPVPIHIPAPFPIPFPIPTPVPIPFAPVPILVLPPPCLHPFLAETLRGKCYAAALQLSPLCEVMAPLWEVTQLVRLSGTSEYHSWTTGR